MKLAWKILASTALVLMLAGSITSAAAGNWGCASEWILAFVWCPISIQHYSRAESLEGWVECYKRQCNDLDECLDKCMEALMDKNNSLCRKRRELEDKTSAETGEWISASERLPEPDEFVLCVVSGKHKNITFDRAVEIACETEEGWSIEAYPEWENPNVTHWMPLPDPPKPEGGANNAENDPD